MGVFAPSDWDEAPWGSVPPDDPKLAGLAAEDEPRFVKRLIARDEQAFSELVRAYEGVECRFVACEKPRDETGFFVVRAARRPCGGRVVGRRHGFECCRILVVGRKGALRVAPCRRAPTAHCLKRTVAPRESSALA